VQIPDFFTIDPPFHPQIASHFVIPAKTGIHFFGISVAARWIPAFAGTSLTRVRFVAACVRKQPAIDLAGAGV